MIAVDSSSFIAFLKEDSGADVDRVSYALENEKLILPPIVVTEVFSNHRLPEHLIDYIKALPVTQLLPNFWQRAGVLRAKILSKKLKARLADTLIAPCCIDFAEYGSLILLN